jgi:hypothetical protein
MNVDMIANNIKFKLLSQKERDDFLLGAYEKVLDRINRGYVEGALEFIAMTRKDLYQSYLQTEDTLNQVWSECLEGRDNLSSFMDLTEQYYSQVIEGVNLYKCSLDAGHLR